MTETSILRYGIIIMQQSDSFTILAYWIIPNCIYCNEEEYIIHAFLFGSVINSVWNEVETFARDLEYEFIYIEDKDIEVIGIEQQDTENELFNIIILIAKNNNRQI